jgi:hypothetical protein
VNSSDELAAMLTGGNLRSTGRAGEAAAMALSDRQVAAKLLDLLVAPDPLVRMRAADALEKAGRRDPGLLQPYAGRILDLTEVADQKEVRWHLAQMLPRLRLNADQKARAVAALRSYMDDSSAIVRAWSLNAIAELSGSDQRLRRIADDLLAAALHSESAAVSSRARAIAAKRKASAHV